MMKIFETFILRLYPFFRIFHVFHTKKVNWNVKLNIFPVGLWSYLSIGINIGLIHCFLEHLYSWLKGLAGTSRLEQESEDELIKDFQWIFNPAPHQRPAVAITHQPWKRFVKRPVLPVDGRRKLPHQVILHDLGNHPTLVLTTQNCLGFERG